MIRHQVKFPKAQKYKMVAQHDEFNPGKQIRHCEMPGKIGNSVVLARTI